MTHHLIDITPASFWSDSAPSQRQYPSNELRSLAAVEHIKGAMALDGR